MPGSQVIWRRESPRLVDKTTKTTQHVRQKCIFHMWGCTLQSILLMEEILHQLIGRLSHYLQGFIHPRWCRISSINSITGFQISTFQGIYIWFHLQLVSFPPHLLPRLYISSIRCDNFSCGFKMVGICSVRTPQNQTIHLYGALIVPSIGIYHLRPSSYMSKIFQKPWPCQTRKSQLGWFQWFHKYLGCSFPI